jgi:type III restriction enzyme
MATGTGKTWVLQALLVWQLVNKTAALARGADDPRFTRHFLVMAPGLIVHERLLDALCGRPAASGSGSRDFASADLARHADLFVPDAWRKQVLNFVRGNVCVKDDIGMKATGNGMIAITNWHLLAERRPPPPADSAQRVVEAVLPLSPARAARNGLDALDHQWSRGRALDFLTALPELMVFNDEAHHVTGDVEWHKSLSRISAPKGRRFAQVDLSATFHDKQFLPHIVADFDLKAAMRAGLVKSLVLDRRPEIGALPLRFKAERDAQGRPTLSEGQRAMLRAGLRRLRQLEADFARLDPHRHPKMLVVCEDTGVPPLVAQFLRGEEGLAIDDVVAIDSGRRSELGEKEWDCVRERLYSVDRHARPRVIVSVLMLREGFDVNNICVIVPLRASRAPILLEQTIGRGMRLMWREDEYAQARRENRERIRAGLGPASLIDVLTIVEHPAFQSFYDELLREGLASADDGTQEAKTTGNIVSAELRQGFETWDFGIPVIVREAHELQLHHPPHIASLPALPLLARKAPGPHDIAMADAGSYNDCLARLTRRIATLPDKPYLQLDTAQLAGWLDDYICTRLFGGPFDPAPNGNWHLLLSRTVVDHVMNVFTHVLAASRQRLVTGRTEVQVRRLSEVAHLVMRESDSAPVDKCIYTRLAWPAQGGELLRAFIGRVQADPKIEAFCRISPHRHTFARLPYIKDDGTPAWHAPDFLVRTEQAIYFVETTSRPPVAPRDVERRLKAALAWCARINRLPPHLRHGRTWHWAVLGDQST